MFAVENGIVAVFDPVAHVDIGGVAHGAADGCVAVSEKEIMEGGHAGGDAFQLALGAVLVDGLLVVAQVAIAGQAVAPAAVGRPTVGQRKTDVGMDAGKEPLVEAATENTFEEIVTAAIK